MATFNYVVTDPVGIHARPAGNLSKECKACAPAKVFVTNLATGKKADASKVMALMALGIKQGQEITVTVEGDDADAIAVKMEEYFKANL